MTQRSLSTFLTRLIWLSLIPLFLLGAGFAFYNTHRYNQEMREGAQTLTSNIIAYVDHYLDSRIRALNMLAVSPLVEDPGRWKDLYMEAKGYQASFNSHVILSDTASEDSAAQMLFNTRVPFGTPLPPVPRPKGNSAAVQALKTGRPAVGDSFIGPVANQKLVAIVVPAIRDGQITNLIISPLEARQFQVHLDTITLPDKWSLTLADSRGDVIAKSPSELERDIDGQQDEHFRASSGLSPWTVSLTVPSSTFTTTWLETGSRLIFLVVIATAIGAILGIKGGRRISGQVSSLAEAPGTTLSSEFTEVADVRELLNSNLSDLQMSEARHRELFEANPHPMWVYDMETLAFLEVNDAAIRKYGYSRDTFLSMTIKDIRPPEDIPRLLENVATVSEGIDDAGQWRHRTCDGQTIDVEINSHILIFEGRRAELVLANDITERKRADLALQSQARQQMLVAVLGRLALSKKNLDDVYTEAARSVSLGLDVRFCKILLLDEPHGGLVLKAGTGWDPGWTGRQVSTPSDTSNIFHVLKSLEPVIVKDFNTDPRFFASELLVTHGIVSGIKVLVGDDESQYGVLGAYSQRDRKFTNEDINFLQGIANTLSAAIKRWRTEEQISYMAQHDSLTDLPNRLLLTDRLHLAVAHAERSGGMGALLFLDLDRFKNVNDVFGHSLGNRVLQEAAERLLINVRAEDTVCRQGGDEFIIVLPFMKENQDAAQVAEKLIAAITTPFVLGGSEIILGASIGISCFPSDGRDVETLLRNADAAMYTAKDLGRNRYQFYSSEMNVRSLDRLTLESDLHHAIAHDELFVMYQPQQNLKTGRVVGFEALMRWRHPTRGLIPPGQFIPIAENSGLIVGIGTWVLEAACTQHARWVSQGLTTGSIAINVSSHQFRQADFVDVVTNVLERSNLHPELLELELTEGVMMQAIDEVLRKLEKLHALGIKLAIDDFGTGYSSLSYLKQFPLYRLKIDQSFIRGLPSDPESGAITEAIIKMGHSLGLDVLAEGLATEAQEKYLKSIACDTGQGYLYAKPLSIEDCEEFLRLKSKIGI